MKRITSVLLAGGSGTRLWPLSRKSYPKQFSTLLGDETLFQSSAKRLVSSPAVQFDAPITMTNSDFRFIVSEQLVEIKTKPNAILIEPNSRNTAPAILAAASYAALDDPEAILLVAPSDHLIPDIKAFHKAIEQGLKAIADGQLVTFGVKPTHAETAYGYLKISKSTAGGAVPLNGFVEKPNVKRAKEMILEGSYLWNSGIFLFKAKDIIAAFETYAPTLINPVAESLGACTYDLGFCRLGYDAWMKLEDISIDYAVMEKSENLSVVLLEGGWSDLGSWDAVWRQGNTDDKGVVTFGEVTEIDCEDSLLRADSERIQLVGIGLKKMFVVAMNDAVVVGDMSRAQEVKQAVELLKAKEAIQATTFPIDHRPWGWFESLVMGDRFQVKRIHVNSGASLSLQSHQHRAEHWVVVAGTAQVTIDDKIQLVTENQSVFIPIGAIHRVANFGKSTLIIIEVQTGFYLGEDDIVRYDDIYSRAQGAKG